MLAKITFTIFIIYLIVVGIGKFYYKFILNAMDKIRIRQKKTIQNLKTFFCIYAG